MLRLSVESLGEGTPLVLLHGFTGSAAAWYPYEEEWSGRRALAVELPGHGGSEAPPPGTTFEEVADAVVRVLDEHGVGRADLLGYSMGGRVALQVAVRHPERIDRLVIESASPGIESEQQRRERAEADDALATSILRDGLDAFVERWAAIPLFESQARLPKAWLAREREVRLGNSAEGLAAGLRVLSVGRQPALAEELESFDRPTLFIVGEKDVKYLEIARTLSARMPRARRVEVADAGHTIHLEEPQRFWQAVRAFLDGSAA